MDLNFVQEILLFLWMLIYHIIQNIYLNLLKNKKKLEQKLLLVFKIQNYFFFITIFYNKGQDIKLMVGFMDGILEEN